MELFITTVVVLACLAEAWQWARDTDPEQDSAAFKAQLADSLRILDQVRVRLQP